jgi:V8-like Glu-specific endopeptidase
VVPNLSGYPGDKPYGTQWFHAGTIRSVDSLTIYHTSDTMPGHSGSPVWRLKDGQRHIVGIHNYGDDDVPAVQNSARRINDAAFDNLLAWKNAPLP